MILTNGLPNASKISLKLFDSGQFKSAPNQLINSQIPEIINNIEPYIKAISGFNISHTIDNTCNIGVNTIKNIEFNGNITLLTKNTKKSKFLTPSVAGNLLFSLAHDGSVISLIPINLDLFVPFLNWSISPATVYTLLY